MLHCHKYQSERMVKELQKARVHERVYSAGAVNFLSRDLLVNNVGVSESYQSPPHIDKNDIGWTYAFACKCGPCSNTQADAFHSVLKIEVNAMLRTFLLLKFLMRF